MPRKSDIGIDIPGVGTVYFPAEMGMDAITAKAKELSNLGLQHQHNINRGLEAEAQFAPIAAESKMIAEPVRALSTFGGPIGMAYGETKAQQIEQAGGAREGYDPIAIGAQAVVPAALNIAGEMAPPVAKSLYGSALKLSRTIKPEKRLSILETGLSEGRTPMTGSIKKSLGAQKEIQEKVKNVIATDPNAAISGPSVASRVDEVAPRFETVNPEADRAILQNAKDEFIKNYATQTLPAGKNQIGPRSIPEALPATQAQELKKNTYRKLGEAAYGSLKSSEKESQKALARGLKEELEKIYPELKELNAADSKLFDLNRALTQAANRIGNRDIIGLGLPIKTMAAGPAGFVAGLLDIPNVKAAAAIAVNKARHLQKVGATNAAGLAAAGAGRVATSAAQRGFSYDEEQQ